MTKLSGKVAVVTGANQGIGKAIAQRFAQEGCALALAARNNDKLQAVAQELQAGGTPVIASCTDVSREADVEALFDSVLAEFGRVDILVNNAGAFDGGRIDQIEFAAWNNVIGSCLTGMFLCSRRAFASMRETGGGRILNIGSISGQRPRLHSAPYAAAKFGVWGLTQSIALDGRPFGIIASCLHPGNVRVERRIDLQAEDEPMMSMETIAEVALTMVTLPPDVNMLEAIVLPVEQQYLGRG